ncbi:hypothetical protein ACIQXM_09475 [Arthrobacter sp. NPDC097144]|uniref:hypothetical protein n=1 Tax=Arthrobacter sp. NPDC097144 TaxID=3363946 RepID=UPI00380F33F8
MASLEGIPVIDVPWADLTAAVEDMQARGSSAVGMFDAASSAWDELQQVYSEPSTQGRVYAALKDLRDPLVNWAVALSAACTVLQDFAESGKPLQRDAHELAMERSGLLKAVAAEDSPSEDQYSWDRAISLFNERARVLRDRWTVLVAETAAELARISGGTGEGLPATAAAGGAAPSPVSWQHPTGALNGFGAMDPESVVASIMDLSPAELRKWAAANPEAALMLAENRMPHHGRDPERTFGNISGGGYQRPRGTLAAVLAPEGIAVIRKTWLNLTAREQKRLLLLYPAEFGNMNGIPMAQRALANIVTVAGQRELVTRQIAAMGGEPRADRFGPAPGEQALYTTLHTVWAELDSKKTGLDNVIENERQVVMVSLEGDGRIVTMKGTPSAGTESSTVLVPGTTSNLSAVDEYSVRLDRVTGESSANLSFYWQGTDLPNKIQDNASSRYNETGGPLLAGFDAALDLELPPGTRSTYIGYSAGAALVGTAEREGLNSTNIIYLAPSGVGHRVNSVADTQNMEANRYWIQARDDPILAAQFLGGISQGGDPKQMGVTRLESGFINHDRGGPLVSGHDQYFSPDSTSVHNMKAVVQGKNVYLYVPDETYIDEGGVWSYSPLQISPQEYAGRRMPSVPVQSTER